jgi:hypothetical protein
MKERIKKEKENKFLAILDKTSNAACLKVGHSRGDNIFSFE